MAVSNFIPTLIAPWHTNYAPPMELKSVARCKEKEVDTLTKCLPPISVPPSVWVKNLRGITDAHSLLYEYVIVRCPPVPLGLELWNPHGHGKFNPFIEPKHLHRSSTSVLGNAIVGEEISGDWALWAERVGNKATTETLISMSKWILSDTTKTSDSGQQ